MIGQSHQESPFPAEYSMRVAGSFHPPASHLEPLHTNGPRWTPLFRGVVRVRRAGVISRPGEAGTTTSVAPLRTVPPLPSNTDVRTGRRTRRVGGERGAELVEVAIVLPLVLLLLFGIVE